jgi:hypothetical protein
MTPLVISFYTLGSFYEEEAKALEASCRCFNIACLIEGVAERESWVHNCAFKPRFILQKLLALQRPLVWVDADARFKGMPKWEDFAECDIAIRCNPHFPKGHRAYLTTGTLFVNPTRASFSLLEKWQETCERQMDDNLLNATLCWDQVILAQILEKNRGVRVTMLPLSYAKVTLWDKEMISAEETIIEHDLASRQVLLDTALEDQKKTFLERKKAWGLSGIVDYQPTMLHQVGDCCLSLIPFICSFVVIAHAVEQYSVQERLQFAFLARLFPFGHFIEILPMCSLKERLAIASLFTEASLKYFVALPADYVVDIEEMTAFLMREEPPRTATPMSEVQLPSRCLRPWSKTEVHMDVVQHPCSQEVMLPPSNLMTIDEKALDRIENARHLGLV